MDIYHFLNKTFFDSCSKIDNSWRKRKRSIDTKLIVLFLMKIISGKDNHGYAYIINEIWAECLREKIPLPQHRPVSASSMCEARMKLAIFAHPPIGFKVTFQALPLFMTLICK
ncbi:hypothetical protein QPK13_10310 [Photorhabdus tasmaniensis]